MFVLATISVVFLVAGSASPVEPQGSQPSAAAGQAQAAKKQDGIDKSHPDYVVCRSESVIGSRAKKRKVCLTNRQWAAVANDGNGLARKVVEDSRAGMLGN